MHEIICPNCGKAFKVDETGYADILKQVRDREFEQQLQERLLLAEKDKRTAVELAAEKIKAEMQRVTTTQQAEIQALKASLEAGEINQKLAITEAVSLYGSCRHRAILLCRNSMSGVQRTVNCTLHKPEDSGRSLVVSPCQHLCLRQGNFSFAGFIQQVTMVPSIDERKGRRGS